YHLSCSEAFQRGQIRTLRRRSMCLRDTIQTDRVLLPITFAGRTRRFRAGLAPAASSRARAGTRGLVGLFFPPAPRRPTVPLRNSSRQAGVSTAHREAREIRAACRRLCKVLPPEDSALLRDFVVRARDAGCPRSHGPRPVQASS